MSIGEWQIFAIISPKKNHNISEIGIVIQNQISLIIQIFYWFTHKKIFRAFTLVLGTVPAGTCSRNMFSVHTISSSMNDVLKSRVPARTVPAGTRSNHVLGTNRPVSTPPKQVWTLRYREQCSNWAGLSTQLRRARVMTQGQPVNHSDWGFQVAQCNALKSNCAARESCRLQIWTLWYREQFIYLVIWTHVYRELVPRTCSENKCTGVSVPRTYMNGPIGVWINCSKFKIQISDTGIWNAVLSLWLEGLMMLQVQWMTFCARTTILAVFMLSKV